MITSVSSVKNIQSAQQILRVEREQEVVSYQKKSSHLKLNVSQLFYDISLVSSLSAEGTDPLEKVLKNTFRSFEIVSKVELVTHLSWMALSSAFKAAIDVFESMRTIGVLQILLTPQQNERYFLFDPENSLYKKADRLSLLVHTTCKSIRALHRWKLIDLGNIGKLKMVGHLTLFHFLIDSSMVASSFFAVMDFFDRLAIKPEERKNEKWQERSLTLAKIFQGDSVAYENLQKYLIDKLEATNRKIELKHNEWNVLNNLTNRSDESEIELTEITKKIVRLEEKVHKNRSRLQQLNLHDYQSLIKECADRNDKADELKSKNKFNVKCIDLVKLASAVAKIFVITMALVMTAMNVCSTVPAVTLLTCGFISDSIGLAKIIMEKI